MAEKIQVQGLKELQVAMRDLPRKLQRSTIQKALRAAALPMRDDARSRVPVNTGAVRRQIVVQRSRLFTGKNGIFGVVLRVRAINKRMRAKGVADPFYWKFLEFGTSKMPAQPFMRPAFEGNKQRALDVLTSSIRTGIEAIVKELPRGRR